MSSSSETTKKSLRVLLIENSKPEFELIKAQLEKSGISALIECVDTENGFVTALKGFAPDVVLSDYPLAQFDADAALKVLRELSPTTPLIVVTESLNGDTSVAFVRAGVEDLVLKRNLGRLAASIENAVNLRQPLEKLTRRQLEVLKLVAEGRRTREIAKQLRLSEKTVESHRGEVMKRLDLPDVVRLVHYAVRVGLISMAA